MSTVSNLTLEQRIAALEAREEIKEVIANYNHGVDKKDEELFLDVWEEDAVWDIGDPWGYCSNKKEILEKTKAIWEGLPETHHHATNHVINVDIEKGTATAVADVEATATNAVGIPLLISATYWDDLSNHTGKWRLKKRKVKIYYMTPVLEPWSNDPKTRINPKMD
ncbi:SnoaL-like domain-containing protein [Alteribacillus persepolensis]|uniref:SnoaL-like domain-containing protein n=1 Tax=Alteribacillus persepolensis TaxID=568899 RepID=A0A1G8HSU8_9BACI|nr:nuclear transport factor 2 family protein [Alteribacillus persepolensis]SDI09699.1 SnoaL-like domain-containing protein [Alteribacillus persepolensis]